MKPRGRTVGGGGWGPRKAAGGLPAVKVRRRRILDREFRVSADHLICIRPFNLALLHLLGCGMGILTCATKVGQGAKVRINGPRSLIMLVVPVLFVF